MKVNMTPNPLDVVTIHASQGDTEARQWEFELHNNGELIDTSDVSEQMFFKAYKGGTEQILPENTSTPTTSPFLGDIRYPQGLLTDQEFLYRESPTEEDGLAKITDVKGNTLKWNQLVRNGNFANGTNNWARGGGSTISASNNELTVTVGATWNNDARQTTLATIQGHKYYGRFMAKSDTITSTAIQFAQLAVSAIAATAFASMPNLKNTYQIAQGIATAVDSSYGARVVLDGSGDSFIGQSFTIKDVMLVDLTQMFGAGNEPTTVEEFTSLFPLPYYAYNQGSLLSFNGEQIKTVGFNQWDEEWEVGAYNSANGSTVSVSDRIRNKNPIRIFSSVPYYRTKGMQVYYYDANMNYIGWMSLANFDVFTPPSNAYYMNFNCLANSGTTYNNDICINISDPSKNGTYEPYTSSTLSLPISTYFPNGMKDVPDYANGGKIYDEMTSNRADTRVGSVDLGSLNWTYDSSRTRFYSNGIAQYAKKPVSDVNKANMLSAIYDVLASNTVTQGSDNMVISLSTAGNIVLRNTAYTDATAFKTAMSGQYLYYELATPTETSFTTASLVIENAEIPLSNEDGVLIGKCTEQLSENPGFIDAKIKLSDSDGECYSNKIQLHVERSPQ